jgi:hypothetical protein
MADVNPLCDALVRERRERGLRFAKCGERVSQAAVTDIGEARERGRQAHEQLVTPVPRRRDNRERKLSNLGEIRVPVAVHRQLEPQRVSGLIFGVTNGRELALELGARDERATTPTPSLRALGKHLRTHASRLARYERQRFLERVERLRKAAARREQAPASQSSSARRSVSSAFSNRTAASSHCPPVNGAREATFRAASMSSEVADSSPGAAESATWCASSEVDVLACASAATREPPGISS